MAFTVHAWTALLLAAVSECGSLTLTALPAFSVQSPGGDAQNAVRIAFDADSALTACQIHELNRAQALSTTHAHSGQGSRCVAELRTRLRADTHFVFACNAQTRDGDTTFALAVVAVVGSTWRALNASVAVDATSLRITVVAPTSSSSSSSPLGANTTCKFRTPNAPAWNTTRGSHGACALALADVGNGLVLAQARTDHSIFMHAHAHLVPVAPNASSLSLTLDRGEDDAVYEDGDWAIASCDVGQARPVARLSVLLDNVTVHTAFLQSEESPTAWARPWTALAASRRVRFQLRAAHNDSELVCVAHHPSLPQGELRVTRHLSVAARAPHWQAAVGGGVAALGVVVVATGVAAWCWCSARRRRRDAGAAVYRADAEPAEVERETAIYEDIEFSAQHDDSDIYDDVELSLPPERYARSSAPALPPKRR